MKLFPAIISFLFCVLILSDVSARDVSLDSIYISRTSPLYKKIEDAKKDALIDAGAFLVDTGVAFCGWSSGQGIVYVKDNGASYDVYEYFLSSRKGRHVATMKGSVVHATVSPNGKFVCAKSLIQSGGTSIPQGRFAVIPLRGGKAQETSVSYQFIDYSVTPFGASYLREDKGVYEYFPETMSSKLLMPRAVYASSIKVKNPIIPFLSPDAVTIALLNGGGGHYDAKIFRGGKKISEIQGISSAAEYVWIDSSHIAYRSGGPGNFRLMIYDCALNASTAVSGLTMNTNLSFSPHNGIIFYLLDGCISFYRISEKETELYPLEGEDVSFSPNGNSFCTLFGARLYVLQREVVKSKSVILKRNASRLYVLYRDAVKDKNSHENDFSAEYIARKEKLYGKLSR